MANNKSTDMGYTSKWNVDLTCMCNIVVNLVEKHTQNLHCPPPLIPDKFNSKDLLILGIVHS